MSTKSLYKSARKDKRLSAVRNSMAYSHDQMVYAAISYGETIGEGKEGNVEKLNKASEKHFDNSRIAISDHLEYGYTYGRKEAYVDVAVVTLAATAGWQAVKHRKVIAMYAKQQLQKVKRLFKKESE